MRFFVFIAVLAASASAESNAFSACTCKGGSPIMAYECPSDDANRCASCDSGWTLDYHTCKLQVQQKPTYNAVRRADSTGTGYTDVDIEYGSYLSASGNDYDPENCPQNPGTPATCWADSAFQECADDRQGAYDKVMTKAGDQEAMYKMRNICGRSREDKDESGSQGKDESGSEGKVPDFDIQVPDEDEVHENKESGSEGKDESGSEGKDDSATGPGATGPGATGPGDTGPGATGPGDKDDSGSEGKDDSATGLGATGPGDTGPGATGPGDTGPGATGPGGTDSGCAKFGKKAKKCNKCRSMAMCVPCEEPIEDSSRNKKPFNKAMRKFDKCIKKLTKCEKKLDKCAKFMDIQVPDFDIQVPDEDEVHENMGGGYHRIGGASSHLKTGYCKNIADDTFNDAVGDCASVGYSVPCISCHAGSEWYVKSEDAGKCTQASTECYFRAEGEQCGGTSQCR